MQTYARTDKWTTWKHNASSPIYWRHNNTHTQPFNSSISGTTQLGRYQKKRSTTHTNPDHQTSFINFLHLLPSIASSLFSLRAWESSLTTSLQVLFGLGPPTSYSIHSFTQSSSSFHSTRLYHGGTINKTGNKSDKVMTNRPYFSILQCRKASVFTVVERTPNDGVLRVTNMMS